MAQGVDKAIAATADHIASFWDPRMRSQALALRARDPAAFSPEALAALDRLAARA
jgi:formate dehydrogenase subunit delta